MIRKRGLLCVTGILLAALMGGCQGEKTANQSLPEYNKKDVVYRAAWWCPEPTEENYETYKECNLNTVLLANHNFLVYTENFWDRDDKEDIVKEHAYYVGTPKGFEKETATDKALALAKKNGLYVFLEDGNGYFDWIGTKVNVFRDFTIDYSDYKDQIVGVFAGDEPSAEGIAAYAERVDDARSAFPDLPYFCNLLPMYADLNTQIKADSYEEYIDTYCREVLEKQGDDRVISVDFYPFQGSQYLMWLRNYDLLAKKAAEYDAELHLFIQSCIGANANFEPLTEEDIRLQVNVALAYGATSYSYYVYDVPLGGDYESGLVDEDGKPVAMYGYAKNVNAEVASLENALTHYDVVTTVPVSDDTDDYSIGAFSALGTQGYADDLKQSEILEDVQTDNRGLVTILKDEDGNEAYYLVNYYDKGDEELEQNCTFRLKMQGMKQVSLYGSKKCLEGKQEKIKKGTYECTLAPGEGILIVPYVS